MRRFPLTHVHFKSSFKNHIQSKPSSFNNFSSSVSYLLRWESHLHPRKLGWKELDEEVEEEEFGQVSCHLYLYSGASLYIFKKVDGHSRVQRGWLTEEALVQIKIHGGGLDLWRKKEAGGRVFAKMTALERREGDNEESMDMIELRTGAPGIWPIVEAAVRKSS